METNAPAGHGPLTDDEILALLWATRNIHGDALCTGPYKSQKGIVGHGALSTAINKIERWINPNDPAEQPPHSLQGVLLVTLVEHVVQVVDAWDTGAIVAPDLDPVLNSVLGALAIALPQLTRIRDRIEQGATEPAKLIDGLREIIAMQDEALRTVGIASSGAEVEIGRRISTTIHVTNGLLDGLGVEMPPR